MSSDTFLTNILGKPKEENVYEKIAIIVKRAKQITEHDHRDFYAELEKMGILQSNKDQMFDTSGFQEVLAKVYEEKESPITRAERELEQGKLTYMYTYLEGKEAESGYIG